MDRRTPGKKLSLIKLNRVLIVIAAVLASVTVAGAFRSSALYKEMKLTTEKYASYIDAVNDMSDASDYLTDRVRKFINLKSDNYLFDYFTETDETKRRNKAVEYLESELPGGEIARSLRMANDYSNELAETEIYAMRLLIEGMKFDLEKYPDRVKEVELSHGDESLEAYRKTVYAWNLVTNEEYASFKAKIRESISTCISGIYNEATAKQNILNVGLRNTVYAEELLILLLLITVITNVILGSVLVFRPLRKSETAIKLGEKIEVAGSSEMQFFAMAYNRIFERNERKSEMLSYEVTHDALTGILNRAAFDKDVDDGKWDKVAVLIVDIDGFKKINDTYLHSTGDLVLKRVADILRSTFRSDDRVYRIGGDEFAVVMIGAGPEHEDLIRQKYGQLCDRIENAKSDFFGATLSIGVAYGNWSYASSEIFRNADTALYAVKKSGKNDIAFSEEMPTYGNADN